MDTRTAQIPGDFSPFVGRDEELSQLMARLRRPDCRLLTLVGFGGSGKTRLAGEVLRRMAADYADGAYFVPLQSVTSASGLPVAMADAMDYVMRGRDEPKEQMLAYLQHKHCLIVLDNFEHLLAKSPASETPDRLQRAGTEQSKGEHANRFPNGTSIPLSSATAYVSRLLVAAPQTDLLVTSREALNLREEWLFSVHGLPVPPAASEQGPQAAQYGALRLFGECAQRVRPGFSIKAELPHVLRICRLVEGLPLGIELAASWLRYMSCAQIGEEIANNVEFLHTNLRNLPARHRSLRAVFNQSWALMTEREQDACHALFVFPGPFTRDGALQVAEADLHLLSTLVDKSVLHCGADGRYQMHGLLRQYIENRLQETPEKLRAVRQRFASYYAHFLHTRRDDMMGGRQILATQEIAAELDNIRAAWQWVLDERQVGVIDRADFIESSVPALELYYQFTSRYAECAEWLRQALDLLEKSPDLDPSDALLLLVTLGWLEIRLGNLDEAEQVLLRCLEQYQTLNKRPVHGHASDPRVPLGIVAMVRGEYDKAEAYGWEAYRIAQQDQELWNLAFACYVLTNAALAMGNVHQAETYAKEGYDLLEELGDRWSLAYFLNERGRIARILGNYADARQHYRHSYAIRESFDDPEGMAIARNNLGEIALLQHDLEEADEHFTRSLRIYEELDDRGGLAYALAGAGAVAGQRGQIADARRYFHRALSIAFEMEFYPLLVSILNHVATLYLAAGDIQRGSEIVTVVLRQSASDQQAKARAHMLRQEYDIPVAQEGEPEKGNAAELEATVRELLDQLAEPAPSTLSNLSVQEHLPEPLTERELDVLRLLAKGLTNKQIAEKLTIVVGTVKSHNHNIYAKLDVENRTEAVARARVLNLL